LTYVSVLGSEDYYAARLTRSLVVNKAAYIAPVSLRYVFVDDEQVCVRFSS